MILRNLRLVNFRKFSRAEIEFPDGLIGVVGPNGAGKSTIFEAVAWALFGNRMSRTGGFGLSSTSAGAGAACSADLVFERDGRTFRVTRHLTRGGEFTSARVFDNGVALASGGRAAEDALRRIVGLDPPVFLKTVFARQGELAGLAKDTLGYRQRLIEGLLELDRLDRVRGQAAADQRGLDSSLKTPTSDSGRERLESLADEAGRDVQRLREEWDVTTRTLKTLEAEAKRHRALQAEIDVLDRQREGLARSLRQRRGVIEGMGRPPPQVGDEATLARDLGELRGRAKACSLQLSRIARCLQVMNEASGARCPVCGGPLSPDSGRRLEGERRKLREQTEAMGAAERALVERMREEARSRLRAEERARAEREVARLETDLAALEPKLGRLRVELGRSAFDEGAYGKTRKRWMELGPAVAQAASRKAALDARLGQAREADRRRGNRQRAEILRLLEDLLGAFREFRIEGFLPAFERTCSDLLASATEDRYARIRLDRDFNVRMEDGGRPYVIGRFSGGEQDLACLSIRLGLLRLAGGRRPVEFAVLDEIFGSQDRSRRRAVVRALGRLCPPFRQIFVVTHAEDVQELLPATLRVEGGEIVT